MAAYSVGGAALEGAVKIGALNTAYGALVGHNQDQQVRRQYG